MTLSQITQARWFPTVTKPLLAGLLTAAVLYGLKAVGVTSFASWQVNNAVSPVAGLLVAAIVQRPMRKQPTAAPEPPAPSVGRQVARMLLDDVAQAVDSNPDLLKGLALGLITGQQSPPPTQHINVLLDGKPLAQQVVRQGLVAQAAAVQGGSPPEIPAVPPQPPAPPQATEGLQEGVLK